MRQPWLNVSHVLQTAESDCLVACVSMVLGYLGQPLAYDRIAQILQTRWFGTPARNVLFLEQVGVRVVLQEQNLPAITNLLEADLPVIAFVDTADLPYWNEQTDHAIVIIGADADWVYVNDPYFHQAPQKITHTAFTLAQLKFDDLCAIITKPTPNNE